MPEWSWSNTAGANMTIEELLEKSGVAVSDDAKDAVNADAVIEAELEKRTASA